MKNYRIDSLLELDFAYVADSKKDYAFRWCNSDTNYHKHLDFYEMILVTKGTFKHYCDQNIETFSEGTLLIYDKGCIHRMIPASPECIHFTICLTKSYFQLLGQLFSVSSHLFEHTCYRSFFLNDTLFQYLLMLSNTLIGNSALEERNIRLFFHNAIHLFSPMFADTMSSHMDPINDIVEKICNYTYLTLSVQEIYDLYPYSIPTIIKKFKERTGTTISRFQTKVRLEYAARLLRETNRTIEQIVLDIGLLSTGHFYNMFKESYGLSPDAYRRNFANQNL